MSVPLPPKFTSSPTADTLVVLLHGSTLKAHSLQSVQQVVQQEIGNVDCLCPELPLHAFSFADPQDIVQGLLAQIDRVWQAKKAKPYDHVILIGHSAGALLARKLYSCACGVNEADPFAPITAATQHAWVKVTDRIILLAGMNRGWSIIHNLSLDKRISFSVGTVLGELCLLLGYQPLLFQMRRGAPFITNLRLQWLAMRQQAPANPNLVIIQLLGSDDDMVSPTDNLDLVTGQDFIYLDVPLSGHANVIEMAAQSGDPAAAERRQVFVKALKMPRRDLMALQIRPVDADLLPREKRKEVNEVVFVIHGIRDYGFWTHKIAQRVKKEGEAVGRIYETETSGYGYFAMLPFLLLRRRRAKVEWLMDQYTEDLALYPNAKFSFVGHSNGTYLLAKALQEYPACRFKHVVFAGSVVPTHYQWQKLIVEEKRVERVLNYVATADWVVAFFPRGFQMLGWQDLGSAGYDGFDPWSPVPPAASQSTVPLVGAEPAPSVAATPSPSGPVYQVKYVKGGHGAALQEAYWQEIAHFIVHGELLPQKRAEKQFLPITLISRVAPLLWLGLLICLVWLGRMLWAKKSWPESVRTLGIIGYLRLLWFVITRF